MYVCPARREKSNQLTSEEVDTELPSSADKEKNIHLDKGEAHDKQSLLPKKAIMGNLNTRHRRPPVLFTLKQTQGALSSDEENLRGVGRRGI